MERSVSRNKMLKTEVEVGDMFSHLPDALILHILSFLPAKEAVATSLVCKRWRPLWTSLPTLDLHRSDFQRLKFFHQFVEKLLKFVDLKSVKKFAFRFRYYDKYESFRPSKISNWINAVMSNKVEHLELNFFPKKGFYELPTSIFIANNLNVLKLSGIRGIWEFIIGVEVGVLSHVSLPLLEVLELDAIKFSNCQSLGMLLSACSSLKHLVLKDLYGNLKGPLDIGRFNHLVSADVPKSLLPLKVISNVTFLRIDMPDLSPCPDQPTFPNLTCLEYGDSFVDWETIFKYLHGCPKLEIFILIEFACSESLDPTVDVPHCVSSSLKEFHIGYYHGKKGEFELARFIMKNAMVLRTISLTRSYTLRATWESQNLKRISKCPITSMNCKLLLK